MLTELVITLVVSVVIGLATVVFFCVKSYLAKVKDLETKLKLGVVEGLELATTEQLMSQLRGRSSFPYVMLTPVNKPDNMGFKVEVHGIEPLPCAALLQMATSITLTSLRERGLEIPEMPEFPGFGDADYDDED